MCAARRCESGAGRTIQLKGESVAGQRKYKFQETGRIGSSTLFGCAHSENHFTLRHN